MTAAKLDPDLLRAFVAVAERLSFTRAASVLNRSQAAVSLQVKRLEERLGVALFHRTTSRVELTATARDFLVDARRILALHEQALARLADNRSAGRLRLGVMEDYGTRWLPRLLADAAARYPLVEVEMDIGLTSRMLRRLGSSFDAVISMQRQDTTEGELLRLEEAAWVCVVDGAAEARDPLPVALSSPDCLFRQWASRALDACDRSWRLAYVSTSLAAVEAIVEQGLAITVIKRSMLTPRLRELDARQGLPALPRATIRLHRATTLTPPAALVVDHLAQGLKRPEILAAGVR